MPIPLVRNGSFEEELPGVYPPFPDAWLEVRHSERDEIALVDDPRQAHWGRRCLRLFGADEAGVRVYALDHLATDFHGLNLDPGQTYVVTVWARAEAGKPAKLNG